MNLKELIEKINQNTEELDLVTVRKLIEENLSVLQDNKNFLKKNARELLNFINERINSGEQPLSRQEMAIISTINTYAAKFDVRGLKVVIKDHAKLLLRKDIVPYFNSDAKILLESMGAITKE